MVYTYNVEFRQYVLNERKNWSLFLSFSRCSNYYFDNSLYTKCRVERTSNDNDNDNDKNTT